jgi:hypothetical protein
MVPGSTKGMVDVIDCQFHLKLSLQVLPYLPFTILEELQRMRTFK